MFLFDKAVFSWNEEQIKLNGHQPLKFGYLQTKAYLSDISVFLYLAVLLLTGRKEKIAGILNMTKIRKTRGILDDPI